MAVSAGWTNLFRDLGHTDFILDPQMGSLSEFAHPLADRGPGQTGGSGHHRHSPSPQGQGLTSSPLSSHPLVHQRTQQFELGPHSIEWGWFFHPRRVSARDYNVQLIF